MVLNKDKPTAIAKLKDNVSAEKVAKELDLPVGLVQEWEESLTEDERTGKEVNAIAIRKATDLIENMGEDDGHKERLGNDLIKVALILVEKISAGANDTEIAKSLNISADTVSKLYNAFFSKGSQVSLDNSITNNIVSKETLHAFRENLKD